MPPRFASPAASMAQQELLSSLLVYEPDGSLVSANSIETSSSRKMTTSMMVADALTETPRVHSFETVDTTIPDKRDSNTFTTYTSDNMTGYANLSSIDDWEAENPYSPPKKLIRLEGGKADPQAAIDFHHLCEKHRLTPIFEYFEPEPCQFSGRLVFGELEIREDARFPSKPLIKQALCKRAIPELQKRTPPAKVKQQTSTAAHRSQDHLLVAENWIGVLQGDVLLARDAGQGH
jgi:hypothetical protein